MAQIKLEIHAENAADLVSAIRDLAGSALVASHPVETAEQAEHPEPETSTTRATRTRKPKDEPKTETPVTQEAAPAAPENPTSNAATAEPAASTTANTNATAADAGSTATAPAATDAPTFDQVRMVMADVMRKIGKASDIQELLQKQFGVASPNKLLPDQYGAAIDAMKAMIAGK